MKLLLATFLFVSIPAWRDRAADLPLADGDRLVFMGHSLTLPPTGLWSDYMRAYLALHNPTLTLHMQEIARSGMSIDGCFSNSDITLQHYDQYAYALQPKYVFFLFGGAGGFTQAQYQSNVMVLIDSYIVGESSATPVIIGMTPEPDATGFAQGINFENAEVAAAQSYTPNKLFTTNWSALVPRFTNSANWPALQFAPGDVHPSKAANIAQAWKAIQILGWDTNVSTAAIDASALSVSATNHCTIRNLSGNNHSLSFVRHDDRLPWAIDEAGRSDAANIWPEMIGWQNYNLSLTNLVFGDYDVFINSNYVGRVSSVTLSNGWNMSDLTNGPAHDICQNTLNAIRDMQDNDRIGLTNLNTPKGVSLYRGECATAYQDHGKRGATLIADAGVQSALASINTLDAAIRTAAQPSDFTFQIVTAPPRYAPFHR